MLIEKINALREQLQTMIEYDDVRNDEVLEMSQELDKLIVEYIKLQISN